MPFLPPNQQRQSTEGNRANIKWNNTALPYDQSAVFARWCQCASPSINGPWRPQQSPGNSILVGLAILQSAAYKFHFKTTLQHSAIQQSLDRDVIHYIHTRAHPFKSLLSGTTWLSQYHRGKTNLDFTEARNSQWQWHELGHMQVCTSLQTDNHDSTSPHNTSNVQHP